MLTIVCKFKAASETGDLGVDAHIYGLLDEVAVRLLSRLQDGVFFRLPCLRTKHVTRVCGLLISYVLRQLSFKSS